MHPHLVAGEGLEPPSSAYETELETTSSLTRDMAAPTGFEPVPRTVTGWYCDHSTMEPFIQTNMSKNITKLQKIFNLPNVIKTKNPPLLEMGFSQFISRHIIPSPF